MPSQSSSRKPRSLLQLRATSGAALALALLAMAPAVRAQSLQELYTAARGYDATYQSARLQADSVVYRAEQSRALNRPVVNATGTVLINNANTPHASTTATRTNQQSLGVTASQSLFNAGNQKTIEQAERAIDVARAQLLAAEQDLIVRVTQAYFDVLASTDALATVRASKAAISEQLASAKRNFEVGTATITDTREAQARFDLAVAQELAAENDLNVKRLALDSVVGRSGAKPKPMAVPVVLPKLEPTDVEAWATQADANSPALKQLRLAQDVAQLETEKARAGNLPTIGLSASLTDAHTRVGVETRAGSLPASSGTGSTSNIAVQVAIPLFAGWSIQNRIKETLSLQDKAQSDLDAGRRSVAQGTRTAFYGVRSLHAQVAALEAAESSSKLALESTQLGYKVGVRVNLDVLNAQTQLFQAQRDLAKARYDVVVNGLKLKQAAGTLSAQDVTAVDALLAR